MQQNQKDKSDVAITKRHEMVRKLSIMKLGETFFCDYVSF